MPKTLRRRDNDVAASYVENALKRRTIQAFRDLSSSPCAHCRKDALRKFLDLKRRLQKMDNITKARAGSLPPSFPIASKATAAPVIQRPVVQPLPQPLSQPLQDLSKSSKKRRISESEPPDAKPQQQSKKPRKQEEPLPKKPDSQSQKQAGRQLPADETSKPSAVQNKGSKMDLIASKPSKGDQISNDGKVPKSPKSPAASTPKSSNSWPASVGKQKIKGLSNPSQWCYRRSLLQSLIATPQLFNLLNECHKPCSKQGRCVTCAMRQLLISYHASPGGVGSQLSALDGAIRMTGKNSEPRWSATSQTQEDSHDFLQYLLGTFEKAKGIQKEHFDFLFRVKHKISWTCDGCKKVHTHSDPPGFSLTVPVPNKSGVTLADCMNTYHREPNVTIRCDKCKKNAKRTRIFKIENAPEVLTIHIMRFGYGGRGPTKNKQHIDYPEELDLSPWVLDKSKPQNYRLQAIVAHSGSLKFGHYIAYVRGADGIKEISDSSVTNSSSREWKKPTSGFNPYILFYVKQ